MLKTPSLREKALLILSECTHLDLKTATLLLREDIRPLIRLFSKSRLAIQILYNCSRTSRSDDSLKTIEQSNLIEELVDLLCKKDDWIVSKAVACLGNLACEYPELQNEIRACGGIEDLTDVLKRCDSSWSTSLLEACLVTFENIMDGNERNKNAFMRVNGIDCLVHILSNEKIAEEDDIVTSCYQLFLRCTSSDANEIRNLLRQKRRRSSKEEEEKDSMWIRNVANSIVRDEKNALASSVLSILIRFAPPFRSSEQDTLHQNVMRTDLLRHAVLQIDR